MKQKRRVFVILVLFCIGNICLYGQSTVASGGGTATGSGGSVTYTVGQVACSALSGSNGSVIQGVQQPWEISVVTAVDDSWDVSLAASAYPNPTTGVFRLVVNANDFGNLKYSVFDINGLLLLEGRIESKETIISLSGYSSSLYLLKIFDNNKEIKVFKIIKN
jgi:hypothetical protein